MHGNERVQQDTTSQHSTQEKLSRDFKGIWIPREIWLRDDISCQEKCLWAEVHSLYDREKGGCFATNEYLANFTGLQERRVREMLSDLKEKGLIEQVSFDGRTRVIRAILPPEDLSTTVPGRPAEKCRADRNFSAQSYKNIHTVEQTTDVVVKKQENVVVKSAGQSLTKDDLYSAGLRFNWIPDEIEQAWKIYSSSTKLITDPLKYIEGIINKIRQNNKTNIQKEQKCQKQQTNMIDSSKKSKNVNVLPSVSDMPESPLAEFAFRHGRKPNWLPS